MDGGEDEELHRKERESRWASILSQVARFMPCFFSACSRYLAFSSGGTRASMRPSFGVCFMPGTLRQDTGTRKQLAFTGKATRCRMAFRTPRERGAPSAPDGTYRLLYRMRVTRLPAATSRSSRALSLFAAKSAFAVRSSSRASRTSSSAARSRGWPWKRV